MAASGGRMGGSSFSSSSSSSSSSYPSSSPSSYSSSSSSSSYESHSSYSSSSSYESPSSYSSSSSCPSLYSLWSSYQSRSSEEESTESSITGEAVGVDPAGGVDSIVGVCILFTAGWIACWMAYGMLVLVTHLLSSIPSPDTLFPKKTSVLKLQVGLSGKGRSLQRDLNRIAEIADSSTPQGLVHILKETTRALLRYPEHCISGYSSVDAKKSILEVEKLFNQLSIEERSKFDEETLVNVNNIKKKSATTQCSNDISNEYIVVTIIVAAEGVHKLPPINNSSKLKEALQKLLTISSTNVKAVDVMWTPQHENDILTKQEYLEDYSSLRSL